MTVYRPILSSVAARAPFELERLVDEGDILTVSLLDKEGRPAVIVSDGFVAYRRSFEGDTLSTLAEIAKAGLQGKSIYEAEGSKFVRWFDEERESRTSDRPPRHFIIITDDAVVEVLAYEELMCGP